MRKTIFGQFLLYIIIFGVIIALSSFIVIEYYFNQYYYDKQQDILTDRSKELVDVYNEYGIDKLLDVMSTYAVSYNMSIQFFTGNQDMLWGTQGQRMGRGNMQNNELSHDNIGKVFITKLGGASKVSFSALSYLLETNDGNLLLTKISFESMDAAVSLVKRFFLILSLIIAVLFIIFAFIFSRQMSKPLRKLNDIATKMGDLDFSLRYEDVRVDEIGQLGNTLNTLTQKLESTISQLTDELQKEKTLEKMRRQFTAQVSHELQTPLSVIKGYSEALLDNLYDKKDTFQTYDIILSETNKISKMVDDLLDLSQMESGVYVVRKEQFNFSRLINKIFIRYQNLSDNYEINLDIDITKKLYFGDPLRIEQALDNILANAVKYVSYNGKIIINFTEKKQEVILTITNDGTPIAANDLPYIFDSYYQGNEAIYGSGLGLAITKHIIELHNGTITASNVENGVRIEIHLPI